MDWKVEGDPSPKLRRRALPHPMAGLLCPGAPKLAACDDGGCDEAEAHAAEDAVDEIDDPS